MADDRGGRAPVRVALVGTGAMGEGLLRQSALTPDIETVAIADVLLDHAIGCAERAGRPYRVVESTDAVADAVRRGELAVCADGHLLAAAAESDVLLEATSSIAEGGEMALAALEHGKHLVLMNAEVDLMFGPFLLAEAERRGLVYTSCDGDQHGVIKRLYDEVTAWGFEPVMAGNIKGFLDRYANPTTIGPEADKRRLDHRMCTAYTDGTKLCIEMALVANALGMSTPCPGMTGPRLTHVGQVHDVFDFEALAVDGPVVDYILGAEPGGGVFLVGRCDDDYQQRMLAYYKMGDGPCYLFYRPYHLCHIEAMACIREVVREGRSLLRPAHGFRTDVVAYAKRDLAAGAQLDGVGGYTCYGLIENHPAAADGLPIGLAEDLVLRHAVARDERIGWAHVDVPPGRRDVAMYRAGVAVPEGVE